MHSEIEAAVVDSVGEAYRPRHGETRPAGNPCANCGAVLIGPWCHDCGQLAEDFHRSILKLLGEVVEGLTHLDGRLWRTLPNLVLKPGKLTRDYIRGHRAAQIPPLRLFLVVLLIFFLSMAGGHHNDILTFRSPAERAQMIEKVKASKIEFPGLDKRVVGAADWFKTRLQAVLQDPERYKLILESQEERFAFLALPVATLLLSLVFVFQRRFYVFDHTIFSLHSLSFVGLLLTVSNLVNLVINVGGLLLLLAPVHLFVHMRGFYQTGVFWTLVRMSLLALGSLVAFVFLFLALLLVGLAAMAPG